MWVRKAGRGDESPAHHSSGFHSPPDQKRPPSDTNAVLGPTRTPGVKVDSAQRKGASLASDTSTSSGHRPRARSGPRTPRSRGARSPGEPARRSMPASPFRSRLPPDSRAREQPARGPCRSERASYGPAFGEAARLKGRLREIDLDQESVDAGGLRQTRIASSGNPRPPAKQGARQWVQLFDDRRDKFAPLLRGS